MKKQRWIFYGVECKICKSKEVFMRKIAVLTALVAFFFPLRAFDGMKYFEKRNSFKDRKEAVKNIDLAIAAFKAEYEIKKTDRAINGLAKSVDFKYYFLDNGTKREKTEMFKAIIADVEFYMKNNEPTPDIAYAGMVAWGRYGEVIDKMQAALDGVADKVRFYGELLRRLDPSYFSYAADVGLGRLHYKAPNIIFVLAWPDKRKSKQYLENALKNVPKHFTARYYLAETLWELGEKDAAKKMFLEVISEAPRQEFYYEDLFAKGECEKRAEALGIKKRD